MSASSSSAASPGRGGQQEGTRAKNTKDLNRPIKNQEQKQQDEEQQDWLDKICDRATILCPVPSSLPSEAFDPALEQKRLEEQADILDHVFEGMERTLSLTTATRVDRAVARRGGELLVLDDDDDEDDHISSLESPRAVKDEKDVLDHVFERVESMTCGAMPEPPQNQLPPSAIVLNGGRKPPTTRYHASPAGQMIYEDDFVSPQADLESQAGVRFRDAFSFVTPERQYGGYCYSLYSFPKGYERQRVAWILLVVGILILVLTGIILVARGGGK